MNRKWSGNVTILSTAKNNPIRQKICRKYVGLVSEYLVQGWVMRTRVPSLGGGVLKKKRFKGERRGTKEE